MLPDILTLLPSLGTLISSNALVMLLTWYVLTKRHDKDVEKKEQEINDTKKAEQKRLDSVEKKCEACQKELGDALRRNDQLEFKVQSIESDYKRLVDQLVPFLEHKGPPSP